MSYSDIPDAVAFNADGTRLLAGDAEGNSYVWVGTTGYPFDEIESLAANATAETARGQPHLQEEAARWREQSRPRPDWHRDQAAKAEAAGPWFAVAFHHRQLARLDADQGAAAAALDHTRRADARMVRHAIVAEAPRPVGRPAKP